MAPGLKRILLFDVVLALIAHAWFKRKEPKSIFPVLMTLTGTSGLIGGLLVPHFERCSHAFLLSFVVFTATLSCSIVAYRLSPFHPLAVYPGPVVCKISKLWGARIAWTGKPQAYYNMLHAKYGPIVRIGPNELSVIDTNLIPSVLGMPKGPMWDGRRILPPKNFNKQNSLTSVRDLRRHAELRRPWNNAFKPSAIASYEGMLVARAEQLVQKLTELCGSDSGTIDLALWINYFTLSRPSESMSLFYSCVSDRFDFMGDVAFGGVYSLMRDGDKDEALLKMRRGVFLPSVTQHIPWVLGALTSLPFVADATLAFGRFGIEQAKKRAVLENSLQKKDLCHYLLEDAKVPVLSKLTSSALLAIVAGSDTTAAVLSNIFYYLIREPEYFERLRDELDALIRPSEPNESIDINSLSACPLLNAVVNETLRLQPPVSSLQRAPAVGTGGKALSSDMYILEGTAVLVSPYAVQRCERHFSPDPDSFWPDRWLIENHTNDTNFVLNRAAFMPFSGGPANCPGKPLAMIELRYLTCLLVRTFDIEFAENYNVSKWEEELVDRFVMLKGELNVKIKQRKIGARSCS